MVSMVRNTPSKNTSKQGKRSSQRLKKLKDSSLVQFVEKVPLLGYAASAGHGIASVVSGIAYLVLCFDGLSTFIRIILMYC